MSASPSLFAIFRVVAIMIARDGEVHEREKKLLVTLMDYYGLSPEQQVDVIADFVRPPSLKAIFPLIRGSDHRKKVLTWLRQVMRIDGKSAPEEQELYEQVVAMDAEATSLEGLYKGIAESLIDRDKDVQFWNDLGKLGVILNYRVPLFRRFMFWWWF